MTLLKVSLCSTSINHGWLCTYIPFRCDWCCLHTVPIQVLRIHIIGIWVPMGVPRVTRVIIITHFSVIHCVLAVSLHVRGVIVLRVPVKASTISFIPCIWIKWIVVVRESIWIMSVWRILSIRVMSVWLVIWRPVTRRRAMVVVWSSIKIRVWKTWMIPIVIGLPVVGIISSTIRWSVILFVSLLSVPIFMVVGTGRFSGCGNALSVFLSWFVWDWFLQ